MFRTWTPKRVLARGAMPVDVRRERGFSSNVSCSVLLPQGASLRLWWCGKSACTPKRTDSCSYTEHARVVTRRTRRTRRTGWDKSGRHAPACPSFLSPTARSIPICGRGGGRNEHRRRGPQPTVSLAFSISRKTGPVDGGARHGVRQKSAWSDVSTLRPRYGRCERDHKEARPSLLYLPAAQHALLQREIPHRPALL